MKIQTVNQLISVFKDISTRHYQINGFGVGDNWENGASEKMHPVLWINPTTAAMPSSDNGYKTFEIDFEVRVFDLVNKDESNENEVLSDCIDILKDIIAEFKGHPYYVNSQLNIIDDINFEAFTEEFDEEVSGWVCEISLMTPVLTSFCGIPSAEITGFEFPGADCPDVNVLCPVFVEDVTGVYPIVVTTTGTTKEVSIVGGGLSDTFVISGEYDNGTLTLTRNDDVDVIVTGFDTGGDNDYTTSATLSGNIITFDRTDTVGAYSVDLTSAINSAPDKFVSSGAYDAINNKIVLTLNDSSTVDIDTSAIGGGGASIYTDNDTIGAGRVATLTDSLTFKDGTVNVQGIGTAGSSALTIYDNDTTPKKLWDFLDNGNVNLGGDRTFDLDGNKLTFEAGDTADGGVIIDGSNYTGNQDPVFTVLGQVNSSFRINEKGFITNSEIEDNNILKLETSNNLYNLIHESGRFSSKASSFKFIHPTFTTNYVEIDASRTRMKFFFVGNAVHDIMAEFDTNFYQSGFSSNKWISFGSSSRISSEDISLQGSTAIKGIGTSGSSALAIYDNDTTPNKLWDFLDNGNVNLGGNSAVNTGNNTLTIDGSGATTSNKKIFVVNKPSGEALSVDEDGDLLVNGSIKNGTYFGVEASQTGYWYHGTIRNIQIGKTSTSTRTKFDQYGTSFFSNSNIELHRIGLTGGGTGQYMSLFKTGFGTAQRFLLGGTTLIGSEDISLQGDTLLNAKVNMPNLPTSATGLSSGDLWNDGGTVKIV